jgi:STE24 endopeptidase
MTEATIFYLILGIITVDFIAERILGHLNRKSSRQPIPEELEGIYDEAQYRKSQAYQREVGRFGLFSAIFSFVFLFLMIWLGGFGELDAWLRTFSPFNLVTSLMFFGVLFLASELLGLPFDWYSTFVIEEKYGFNKTTVKTFMLDKLKGLLLTVIIGGLLLSALIYLVASMGSGFWLYFWGIITAFVLFMNVFYTSLILPLFNKLKPLEDGVLKQSIEKFSIKVSFPLKNIFVMDGSRRSSKGNAFFSGLGKKKKVVLFDTLIENHETDELTAVFAHEVGHYKKKHIVLSTVLAILQVGLMLYLLSRMIYNSEVSWAMGGTITAIHLNILAFGILFQPVSRILGLGMNLLSRKNEFQADAYAARNYGAEPLITALKKLSSHHLSNLTPHPAYVFLHYSHPPLLQRVRALKRYLT